MSDDRDAASLFVTVLAVPESVAVSLVRAGMTTLEEVAYVPLLELLETPGVGPEILKQAREKARVHLAL
jgi:transcription termination/antitermination protein NusA